MYFKLLIFLLAMIHSSVKIENPFAETLALSKKEGKEILLYLPDRIGATAVCILRINYSVTLVT